MQIWVINLIDVLLFQLFNENGGRHLFAVHKEYLFDCFFDVYSIFGQQILAGMTGKAANGRNFRPDSIRLAKNLDLFFAVRQAAA